MPYLAEWFQLIATLASFLVLGTVYIVNGRNAAKVLGERLRGVDHAIQDFRTELKKLQDVIVAQALQDGRMQVLDERTLQQGKRLDSVSKILGKVMIKMSIPDED